MVRTTTLRALGLPNGKKGTNKGYSFLLGLRDGSSPTIEFAVPSARMALKSNINLEARYQELEALDERRETTQAVLRAYHARLSGAHDLMVKERKFKEGDLVLKNTPHCYED